MSFWVFIKTANPVHLHGFNSACFNNKSIGGLSAEGLTVNFNKSRLESALTLNSNMNMLRMTNMLTFSRLPMMFTMFSAGEHADTFFF